MTDRSRLYESSEEYFHLRGSVWMFLAPNAAIEVCRRAATEGYVVARIEGGIWRDSGFEARLDCIWDGADPSLSEEAAHENNLDAERFIQDEATRHTAFILTAPPIAGWPNKSALNAL